MAAPNLAALKAYLGTGHSFSDAELQKALDAETAAQARVCRVPEGDYPADLSSALFRRSLRHLQMKEKPLGYDMGADGSGFYISANDPEIRRLEAPFRKVAVR